MILEFCLLYIHKNLLISKVTFKNKEKGIYGQ